MTFNPVPWAVEGGLHSAAVARLLAYAALGGAEGIVEPSDLKVSALAVPGTSIRIGPGGVAILNRYAGGGQEVYVGRNPEDHVLAYPANNTGSSRYDLVGLRVNDPNFPGGGSAPVDPLVGPYIAPFVVTGVPAGTTKFSDLGGIYSTLPAVALARMLIPATTSTITNAMVDADVRQLARPRRHRELLVAQQVDAVNLTSTTDVWVNWPPTATWQVAVPPWATEAKIVATLAQVEHITNNAFGRLRFKLGALASQNFNYDENWTGNPTRTVQVMADTINLTDTERGTIQTVKVEGFRFTGITGNLQADASTATILDIEFLETAV